MPAFTAMSWVEFNQGGGQTVFLGEAVIVDVADEAEIALAQSDETEVVLAPEESQVVGQSEDGHILDDEESTIIIEGCD